MTMLPAPAGAAAPPLAVAVAAPLVSAPMAEPASTKVASKTARNLSMVPA